MLKKVFIISIIVFALPLLVSANERAATVLQDVGVGPDGQCTTVESCREFCAGSEDNRLVCLDFAREHGLIDAEKADRVERGLTQTGPDGCRGLACRRICQIEENYDRCLAYIEDNELTRREKVERIKALREELQDRRQQLQERRDTLRDSNTTTRPVDGAEIEDRLFQERLRRENTIDRLEHLRDTENNASGAIRKPEPTHDFRQTIDRNIQRGSDGTIRINVDIEDKSRLNRLGGFIGNAIKSFFD